MILLDLFKSIFVSERERLSISLSLIQVLPGVTRFYFYSWRWRGTGAHRKWCRRRSANRRGRRADRWDTGTGTSSFAGPKRRRRRRFRCNAHRRCNHHLDDKRQNSTKAKYERKKTDGVVPAGTKMSPWTWRLMDSGGRRNLLALRSVAWIPSGKSTWFFFYCLHQVARRWFTGFRRRRRGDGRVQQNRQQKRRLHVGRCVGFWCQMPAMPKTLKSAPSFCSWASQSISMRKIPSILVLHHIGFPGFNWTVHRLVCFHHIT